jgi:hypothetical protein
MTHPSDLDPQTLRDFRERVTQARATRAAAWEATSRLVGRQNLPATVRRLAEAIRASTLPPSLQASLLESLRNGRAEQIKDLAAEPLKTLTGLSATKAVRALCLLFDIADTKIAPATANMSPMDVETFVREHANPYDLLLDAEHPSLLDLGAGDLSFAEELAARYLPLLHDAGKRLTLHCVDRLQPGSQWGGPLHADPARLDRLQRTEGLDFRFWGNQDMFDLGRVRLLPTYTIVTCHAPPTPTCAFEPSRLSPALIHDHLTRTKGAFRKVRVDGEAALEVRHGGKALLFPPWKFDVRGPLALLDVLAHKGQLCLLGSVDNEVFWETLGQLLEDDRYRPRDVLFTSETLPRIFGSLHARLMDLPVGGSINLADLAPLRSSVPSGPGTRQPFRFRSVEIRCGALFGDLPAGSTARRFIDMKDEAPPWMLILVPDAV